ncbi:hypothetical protein ACWDRB_47415 [Nonomuraea sp. NPDC003707]
MSESDEVIGSVRDTLRTLLSAATEVATALAHQRAAAAQQAQAADEAAGAAYRERMNALYRVDEVLLREVWRDRWWTRVANRPDRVSDMWERASSWAPIQPYAQATLQHMREQIAERFGLELAPVPMNGDLARLLAAPGAGQAAAEAEYAPPPERVVNFQIMAKARGPAEQDQRVTGARGVVIGEGVPLELFAAEQIVALARTQANGWDQPARYVITLTQGEGPHERHLLTLDGGRAPRVIERIAARRARIIAGQETAPPDERIDAWLSERRRLHDLIRQHDPRLDRAREQLRGEREARGVSAPGAAVGAETEGGTSSTIQPDVETLRRQLAHANMQLRACEAELRGEDPDHVFQAAMLVRDLDDAWWETASPKEIAGVWGVVEQWKPGATQAGMLAHLRGRLAALTGAAVASTATRGEVLVQLELYEAYARGRPAYEYAILRPGSRYEGEINTVRRGVVTVEAGENTKDAARRVMNAWLSEINAPHPRLYSLRLVDADNRAITLTQAELAQHSATAAPGPDPASSPAGPTVPSAPAVDELAPTAAPASTSASDLAQQAPEDAQLARTIATVPAGFVGSPRERLTLAQNRATPAKQPRSSKAPQRRRDLER